MAAIQDLNGMVANIQADELAIEAGITAVQSAFAAFQTGSVTAAAVEAAVANLASAHAGFQNNVTALNALTAPPAPPAPAAPVA